MVTTQHGSGIGHVRAALLMDLVLDLRGHPRLTRWEEQFCLDMQRRVQELGPAIQISPKQYAVLTELRDKVGTELPDDLDEGPDPDRDMDLEPELVGALEEEE